MNGAAHKGTADEHVGLHVVGGQPLLNLLDFIMGNIEDKQLEVHNEICEVVRSFERGEFSNDCFYIAGVDGSAHRVSFPHIIM